MKKLYILAFLVISSAGINRSFSQIHLGAQLSALKNTKENFGITGFGVHARLFLGDNLAIGGNFRLWPKKFEEEKSGSFTVRHGNFVGDIAGMLEYYFGERDTRPYAGIDAGLYFTENSFQISDGSTVTLNQTASKTHFGISPKIGLGLDLTGIVGFFGQIQYNLLFGKAEERSGFGFQSRPIDKFWSFDAGIYLRLKPAGSN